jgi:uncharacterized protein with PIN domain/sulfur carrier protein ThiS
MPPGLMAHRALRPGDRTKPLPRLRAEVRFYAELRDFLAPSRRCGRIVHAFHEPGSVKDVIESYGVPHTEVELVLVNGQSVDFGHRVLDGDRISVYPVFESFDVSSLVQVRPQPLREVRFVLDVHLGKLARRLRLLGFDCHYQRDATDDELVAISTSQRRILLTRDLGLLKRKAVTHGTFVRHTDPREQVKEIVRRFQLAESVAPFTRCVTCNGLLEDVAKAEVEQHLPPMTRQLYHEFHRCTGCGKTYWAGAHHARLDALVAEARASA